MFCSNAQGAFLTLREKQRSGAFENKILRTSGRVRGE
jgi:hypothetical protein